MFVCKSRLFNWFWRFVLKNCLKWNDFIILKDLDSALQKTREIKILSMNTTEMMAMEKSTHFLVGPQGPYWLFESLIRIGIYDSGSNESNQLSTWCIAIGDDCRNLKMG